MPVPQTDPYINGPVSTAGVCGVKFLNRYACQLSKIYCKNLINIALYFFFTSTHYNVKTYNSSVDVVADGGYVTHDKACGLCSSLQDLAVYMAKAIP